MDDRLQDRIAGLEADNRRLQRLLDTGRADGELRHRMRATLALLRVVISRSAGRATNVESYAAHLIDRLDAIARAQAVADSDGRIGLHAMIADQLLRYRIGEGERVRLRGPAVYFWPRSGQIMALAIHELAVNAIEHGALDGDEGTLDVTWTADPIGLFTLDWVEHGRPIDGPPRDTGFGTDTLVHMLSSELAARTRLDWPADGLACQVVFAWSDKFGELATA